MYEMIITTLAAGLSAGPVVSSIAAVVLPPTVSSSWTVPLPPLITPHRFHPSRVLKPKRIHHLGNTFPTGASKREKKWKTKKWKWKYDQMSDSQSGVARSLRRTRAANWFHLSRHMPPSCPRWALRLNRTYQWSLRDRHNTKYYFIYHCVNSDCCWASYLSCPVLHCR